MQVALHVTKRRYGAKARNRLSVGGGICGRDDSQEALGYAAASGVLGSFSTPGSEGKTNKQRAGQPSSTEAGAPAMSKRPPGRYGSYSALAHVIGVAATVFMLIFNINSERVGAVMGIINISADVSVANCRPHASMQVALHVTKRQNGAKARNRLSVGGGICGRDDSQEALGYAAASGALGCWTGRYFSNSGTRYGI